MLALVEEAVSSASQVSNEDELVSAFADPDVQLILLKKDLKLAPARWPREYNQGSATGTPAVTLMKAPIL
jgi:hypothetical protein